MVKEDADTKGRSSFTKKKYAETQIKTNKLHKRNRESTIGQPVSESLHLFTYLIPYHFIEEITKIS